MAFQNVLFSIYTTEETVSFTFNKIFLYMAIWKFPGEMWFPSDDVSCIVLKTMQETVLLKYVNLYLRSSLILTSKTTLKLFEKIISVVVIGRK